jgi:hypothetical protein
VIQDPASRFVVAHATGRREAPLAEAAIARARARTGGRPLQWCSDGWESYPLALTQAYRQPVRTGRRGRPPLRVPDGLALTQTIKHRDARGRLLGVETRATIGAPVPRPGTGHVERLNGVLRDRLACLTRKTHAFAKAARTWDAAVGLALFAHNWLRLHPALRQPTTVPGRRYDRRTPAMALGLAEQPWDWPAFLTTHVPISR